MKKRKSSGGRPVQIEGAKQCGFRLGSYEIEVLERLVAEGRFAGKSEAVREIIRMYASVKL